MEYFSLILHKNGLLCSFRISEGILTLLHSERPKLYLHSEWPKLHRVLAILSAIGLMRIHNWCFHEDLRKNYDEIVPSNCITANCLQKDHLNCDPTYELEEMIIEANPLHKKKKRLAKQLSSRKSNGHTSLVMWTLVRFFVWPAKQK